MRKRGIDKAEDLFSARGIPHHDPERPKADEAIVDKAKFGIASLWSQL